MTLFLSFMAMLGLWRKIYWVREHLQSKIEQLRHPEFF